MQEHFASAQEGTTEYDIEEQGLTADNKADNEAYVRGNQLGATASTSLTGTCRLKISRKQSWSDRQSFITYHPIPY